MVEIFVPNSKNLPAGVAGWELLMEGRLFPGLPGTQRHCTSTRVLIPTDCLCTVLHPLILKESLSHHPKTSKILYSCHHFSSQAKLFSQNKDYSGTAGQRY